jgi:hypothetical protein
MHLQRKPCNTDGYIASVHRVYSVNIDTVYRVFQARIDIVYRVYSVSINTMYLSFFFFFNSFISNQNYSDSIS